MELADTQANLTTDLNTLIASNYFEKGKFDGVTKFEPHNQGLALEVKWRNHQHYSFRIKTETVQYGTVKMTFAIASNREYFDWSATNHHHSTFVYTQPGESLVDEMRKQFTALANLTASNADLNK